MTHRRSPEDWEAEHQDWLAEQYLDSVEAEEARWAYRMRLAAEERGGDVHYSDRPGIDRRLFRVSGEA